MTQAWRRWLAGAAGLAGALAALAGSPHGRLAAGREAPGAEPGQEPGRPGSVERSEMGGGDPAGSAGGAGGNASRGIERSEMGGGDPAGSAGGAGGNAPRGINVTELARIVADQEDHIPAIELARWIRARRPGLRVIDVRSAAEFRIFHIPGAEHVALEALADTRFAPDETVVLYSEAGIHGAQAWVFLRALGHRRAYFLRGGLREWLDDVMSPELAADAPPDARAAFDEVAELSRWFGGTPRPVDRGAAAAGAAVIAGEGDARLSRGRGC